VILGVLAGGELGGVIGVLLSVPSLAVGLTVVRYVTESMRQQADSDDLAEGASRQHSA